MSGISVTLFFMLINWTGSVTLVPEPFYTEQACMQEAQKHESTFIEIKCIKVTQ